MNHRRPGSKETTCWCVMANIPKVRINNPNVMNFVYMLEHTL